MALKATIYKATVNVADLDRNQFLDASLTLARHPSETQERMMLRLLAWLKYADERLQFTRGLCADDEPEAWLRNDHLGIDLWIELGLPDERRIKKACTQAAEVALFTYNSRAAQIWWQQNQSKCVQFANLSVWTGATQFDFQSHADFGHTLQVFRADFDVLLQRFFRQVDHGTAGHWGTASA